jgi:hypothetical protein
VTLEPHCASRCATAASSARSRAEARVGSAHAASRRRVRSASARPSGRGLRARQGDEPPPRPCAAFSGSDRQAQPAVSRGLLDFATGSDALPEVETGSSPYWRGRTRPACRARRVPRRWHHDARGRIEAGLGPGEANVVLQTQRGADLVAASDRKELPRSGRDGSLSGGGGAGGPVARSAGGSS